MRWITFWGGLVWLSCLVSPFPTTEDEQQPSGDDLSPDVIVDNSFEVLEASDPGGRLCSDGHAACTAWANRGLCESVVYSGMMREICPVSCNESCDVTFPTKQIQKTVDLAVADKDNCSDIDPLCKDWSSVGLCDSYAKYMGYMCARSCDTCPPPPTSNLTQVGSKPQFEDEDIPSPPFPTEEDIQDLTESTDQKTKVIQWFQKLMNASLMDTAGNQEQVEIELATVVPQSKCPPEWLEGEATCFKVIEESGDFYQSLIACSHIGGSLAVIDNEQEWAFVAQQLNASCGYWIGASDRGHEGSFLSVDGTIYAGPPLQNGEDNSDDESNCAAAVTDDSGNLRARNFNCYRKGVGGICERRFSQDMRHCDPGWFLYEGKCLHAEALRGTFQTGRDYCSAIGASLMAPQNEGIYEMMMSLGAGSGFWLGASDVKTEGFWIVESDGSSYTGPFAEGEPSSKPNYDCLSILASSSAAKLEPGARICNDKGSGVVCGKNQYIDLSPLTPEPPATTEEVTTAIKVDDITMPEADVFIPEKPGAEELPENTTTLPAPPKTHCRDGWRYWNFFCYKFEDYATDFFQAVRKCSSIDATLAAVESTEEMAFLAMSGAKPQYWVGSTDRGHEATWVNVDGSLYVGPFASGQPNNSGSNEDCLRFEEYVYEDSVNGLHLDDVSCDSEGSGYVCKHLANILEEDISCDEDWHLYEDNCYYLNHNHFTWQEAKEACEFIQSYLATPKDMEEVQFYHQIGASHGYWLGARDTVTEGNWTTVEGEPYQGPPVNNNPEYQNLTFNCMDIGESPEGHLFVSDNDCGLNGTGGICKKDKRPYEMSCPPTWYMYEGSCYKLVDTMGTYTDAVKQCEIQSGRLATTRHKGILAFFLALGAGKGFWLGATDNEEDGTWLDQWGEKYNGVWGEGEPDGNGSANCQIIWEYFGVLDVNDVPCEYYGSGVVCELQTDEYLSPYAVQSTPHVPIVKDPDPMCPPDWFHFLGACYIAVPYEGDFYSAVGVCGDMGGFLAVFDTIQDKNKVIEIGAGHAFWLGASDEGHEGNWTTVKGGQYTGPWGPDQPDNGGPESQMDGGQNCQWMRDWDGMFNVDDEYCRSVGMGFVCQKGIEDYRDSDDEMGSLEVVGANGSLILPSVECDDEWALNDGVCLRAYPGNFTWFEARELCESLGTFLAFPNKPSDIAFFSELAPSSGWLGVTDNQKEGNWVTSVNTEYQGIWSTNAPTGSGDCLAVSDGSVVDNTCSSRLLHAVCAKKPGDDSFNDELVLCRAGWRYYLGYCFKVFAKDGVSYNESKELCASEENGKGQLAYPTDAADFEFFAKLGVGDSFWLGADDLTKAGSWVDSDGKTYSNFFAPGYPSDVDGANCLGTKKIEGELGVVNFDCAKEATGFVCKQSPEDSPSCLPGWKLYNGMCYATRTGTLTWASAKAACAEEGARLASPSSSKDIDYFVSIGALHGCWLGANDIAVEAQWKTSSGTNYVGPLQQTGADPFNEADCLTVVVEGGNGHADDLICTQQLHCAMCERVPEIPQDTNSQHLCQSGFTFHRGQCLSVAVNETISSYKDAQKLCSSFGASITAPTSDFDFDFFLNMGSGDGFIIGAKDVQGEGNYIEETGSVYSGPLNRESPSSSSGENCLVIKEVKGRQQVVTSGCEGLELKGTFCVQNIKEHPLCESGWMWQNGHCYKSVRRSISADEAEGECQKMDAHVASPRDQDDVVMFHSAGAGQDFWMGASSVKDGSTWLTKLNTPYKGPMESGEEESGGSCLKYVVNGNLFDVVKTDCSLKGKGTLCYKKARPSIQACPSGFYFQGEFCYQLIRSEGSTWGQLENTCMRSNASLAVPFSQAALSVIKETGAGDNFWLGLECNQGQWVLQNGNSVGGLEKVAELPSSCEEGECLKLAYEGGSVVLSVQQCLQSEDMHGGVCQVEAEDADAQKWCDEGWTFYQGYCYSALSYSEITWHQANALCFYYEAEMATPSTEEELNFLVTVGAQKGFWLGANDIAQEGTWKTIQGQPYDGPWGAGQPNGKGDPGEDCMDVWSVGDNGVPFVNDNPCSYKNRGVVCRKMPSQLVDYDSLCEAGWSFWKGACYKYEARSMNFDRAGLFCETENGAVLGYPQSEDDIAYLKVSGARDKTLLGITDLEVEGNWVTSDKTSYEGPWLPGYPKTDPDSNCAQLSLVENKIYVLPQKCSDEGSGFFCKKQVVEKPLCPLGFYLFEDNCYSVVHGNFSWEEAKEACEEQKSILSSPRSDLELGFYLTLGAGKSFWLGATDRNQEATWISIDGQEYKGPWAPGKPSGDEPEDDCLNIWGFEGKTGVGDYACDERGAGAVCMKKKEQQPDCSPGWYLYDGKCYTRILGDIVYDEGKQMCDSFRKGSIITAPEHYGILDFLLGIGVGSGTWLGATDRIREGSFFTERNLRYGRKDKNGAQIEVFSFDEPDGGKRENCLMVDISTGSLGVFDTRCDRYGTGVVCEYIPDWSMATLPAASTTAEPEFVLEKNPCGDGWDLFDDSCFKMFPQKGLIFYDALLICAQHDSSAATITTKEQLEFIGRYEMSDFLIGGGDVRVESSWQHITGELFDDSMAPLLNFDPRDDSVLNLDVLMATFDTGGGLTLAQTSMDGDSSGVLCERPLSGFVPCPPGYALFFGYCYKFFEGEGMAWNDASEFCDSTPNGRLAVPTDKADAGFIRFLGQYNESIWLGSTDSELESFWKNSGSGSFNPALWNTNQPDGGAEENCLALDFVGAEYGFVDNNCEHPNSRGYVCESNAAGYAEPCPEGWDQRGDVCIQYFGGFFNWFDAVSVCALYDSIVAVANCNELGYYLSKAPRATWLGASDTRVEGEWRNIDLSPFSHSCWGEGQPSGLNPNDDCLMLHGEMKDYDCYKNASGVLCQKPTSENYECPPNYCRFFERCFKANDGTFSYADSQEKCEQEGTILGSPHFEDDLEFLKIYGRGKSLITGTSFESLNWVTKDGDLYMGSWMSGEPDGAVGYCMKLASQDGLYGPVDDGCLEGHEGFLCEIQAENISVSCDDGWLEYSGSCYRAFSEQINWFQAVKTCSSFDAYPAVVTGVQEQDFIFGSYHLKGNKFWYGAADFRTEGSWQAVDGGIFDQSLLGQNDPTPQGADSEDCLMSFEDSMFPLRFTDYPCTQRGLGVVCEKPIETITEPCPVNYTRYFDKCYKPVYERVFLKESYFLCSEENSIAAYPETDDEIEFLKAVVESDEISLGVESKEGEFIGADEGKLATGWLMGHPLAGNDCAGIGIEGYELGMVSRSCDQAASAFACQVDTFQDQNNCPRGWHPGVDDTCYRSVPLRGGSWYDSVVTCSHYAAHPAIVNSYDERDYILSLSAKNHWMGTSDILDEGNFLNIDGTNFPLEFFQFDQPDNTDGVEDCVMIRRQGVATGGEYYLDDVSCESKEAEAVLCERPVNISNRACPSGYIQFMQSCYKKKYHSVEWVEARDACENDNALLSAVDNAHELMWLKALGQGDGGLWLGTSDTGHRGVWINADGSGYYGAWLDGQPDNEGGNQHCMWLNAFEGEYGQDDADCDDSSDASGYICELKVNKTDLCPYGWYQHGQSCYFNKLNVHTWYGAAVHCHFHNNAHLTHVDSAEEMMFAEEFGDYSKWLGLTTLTFSEEKQSGEWVYCTGEPMSSKLLSDALELDKNSANDAAECALQQTELAQANDSISPTNASSSEEFVQPETGLGAIDWARKVMGKPCGDPVERYRPQCELDLKKEAELPCNRGWLHHLGRCYKYFELDMSWYESKEFCRNMGSYLAVVDSAHELEMLKELSLGADNTWLGSTDEGHEGLWINVDGSDYMEKWLATSKLKEPDNGRGGFGEQNCMSLLNKEEEDGLFGDVESYYDPVDLACDAVFSKGFICEAPDEKSAQTKQCPRGWRKIGDSCYRAFSGRSRKGHSWIEAAVYCGYYGAYLAMLRDDDVLEQLNELTRNSTKYWVGVHNFGKETHFFNIDDSEFTGKWAENEPTKEGNLGETMCGYLEGGEIYDEDCLKNFSSIICERPIDGPLCPPNAIFLGGDCYLRVLFHNYDQPWAETSEECLKVGDTCDLVSINDITERDFVKMLGQTNSYIALGSQDQGHENIWRNKDGSTFNPRLWENGEPSDCCGGQDCMGLVLDQVAAGKAGNQSVFIHDLACDAAFKGYICECKSSQIKVNKCPRGWEQYMYSCYKVMPRRLSWADAVHECVYLDASLASIPDDETLDFLAVLEGTENCLVGLTKWGENDAFVNPMAGVEFTGSVSELALNESATCTVINDIGALNTVLCGSPSDGFVCEKPLLPSLNAANCSNGQIPYRGGCYRLFEETLSWNEANSRCKSSSATLVSINSFEELNFVLTLTAASSDADTIVYVGLVDNSGDGQFFTSDGSLTPFNIEFWGYGQPQVEVTADSSGVNDLLCGAAVKQGGTTQVENVDCNSKTGNGYMCEY